MERVRAKKLKRVTHEELMEIILPDTGEEEDNDDEVEESEEEEEEDEEERGGGVGRHRRLVVQQWLTDRQAPLVLSLG